MQYTNTPQEVGFKNNKNNNQSIKNFNFEYNKSTEILKTGEEPKQGIYSCTNCGTEISLSDNEKLPACPRCNNTEFSRIN